MKQEPVTLTPGERQSLLRLVKNDFEQVRTELEGQKSEWLQQEYARIDADHAAAKKAIKDYEKAAQSYADKAKAHLDSLWDKHLAALNMEHRQYASNEVRFEKAGDPPGLALARNCARDQANAALSRALNGLKREELTAQRTLLVSAIESESARKVLEGLPKAADAFQAALAAAPKALAS